MQIVDKHRDKSILLWPSENRKFHFAITGEAEADDELQVFELLHFGMTEQNLSCDSIRLRWQVLVSESKEDV